MFEGILTALITPLKNDAVDFEALEILVNRQLEAGVQGIVVCATGGEGSILTPSERESIIQAVIKQAGGKTNIVVGTGAVSTWASIESTRIASELGADAALIASPSYVKPSQNGIIAHYEAIADQVGLPVIVYNVPSRTSSDVLPATWGRLAQHDKIVAVKEATSSVLRAQQVIAAVDGKMDVLSGEDPITLSILVAGGQGVICTASNVVPQKWTELFQAWKRGDISQAASIQASLRGLHEALFMEGSPGPVKGACYLLGLVEPFIRAPMTWPRTQTLERLAQELERFDLEIQRSIS